MPDGLNKLTEGIGKTIEVVPDLYNDALKSTAQESGKTLALIPRTINAALVPLRQWIAKKEYNLAETEKLLAKKLENVESQKIVTPESYVAIPAIQAISYSMNSNELRNLYANLLAKAMTSDTKDMVHPSFVEIIKQMSPIDAQVFREIGIKTSFTVVRVTAIEYTTLDERSYRPLKNLPNTSKYSYDRITTINLDYQLVLSSIDNLLRLNLIKEEQILYDTIPGEVRGTPVYEKLRAEIEKHMITSNWIYQEESHDITLSNLGRDFYNICIQNL